MSEVEHMPLEIWTDINGNATRTQFKGGVKYIRADERDRLRSALVKCRRELWYCNNQLKYMGATEGYSVTEALCEAGAALTPAGGGKE